MITRREAEDQAERCFHYHVGAYAATVAAMAALNSRSFPLVAGVWGVALLIHGTLLHAIPEGREMLLRNTAALMEDHRSASVQGQASQRRSMASVAS